VRSLASDPIASVTPTINLRTLLNGVIPALRHVLADSLEAALRHHAGPNALDISPEANGEPAPPLPVGPDLPWSVAWGHGDDIRRMLRDSATTHRAVPLAILGQLTGDDLARAVAQLTSVLREPRSVDIPVRSTRRRELT
jgi:hypothetical protein